MSTLTSSAWVESWRALGLDDALPALIEAHIGTLTRINAEASEAAHAVDKARRGRAAHVAEGRPGKLPTVPEPIDFDRARTLAERAFQRDARALGDSLVAELADAHAGILVEAETLVPAIGNLQTDAQALARTTTTEAREAWARLRTLWEDRKTLLGLFAELLRAEVIDDARTPQEQGALRPFRLFANPTGHGRAGRSTFIIAGRKTTPAALQMARLIADAPATRPGIYRLDEARRHLAEWQRAERAELLAARSSRGVVRAAG